MKPTLEEENNQLRNKILLLEDLLAEYERTTIEQHDRLERNVLELATIFDAVPDFMFLLDMDYKIIRANKAFADAFKMKPEDLIGKKCHSVLHGTPEPLAHCGICRAYQTGRIMRGEIFEPTLNRHLEMVAAPVSDPSGNMSGMLHLVRDISERKRMQAEREAIIIKLQEALAQVQTLGGLIPICANCKKIRNDKGFWESVEKYVSQHSEARFSHGVCPGCAEKFYGEFAPKETPPKDEGGR